MIGLQLREEFRGKRLKGTAIEFNDYIEKDPNGFLDITYPTNDLLKLLKSVEVGQDRPVVLMGERGQGKSHLMVTLYHVFNNPDKSRNWIDGWKKKDSNFLGFDLNIRNNMMVIAESLQRQNYKFLWDILLDKHPHGNFIRGKWEGSGDKKTDILGYDLIIEMLENNPVVLILDEFQTWYDSLTNTKQYPWKNWAFNFIQILSEISKERPDLLTLVVSVRNGNTEAFKQIHRVNPIIVDFKGENSKKDRKKLLIHRIFENRRQIHDEDISRLINTHINEYFRILDIPEIERDTIKHEFIDTWPFAPHLMNLLEDQVLVATDAQETRDLIKILVKLYKKNKDSSVILTAAHFTINESDSGVAELLDSVSNDENVKLKDKAIRNLEAIYESVKTPGFRVPNAKEIISSLWIRSLSFDRYKGASPKTIHIDITQNKVIDDNTFSFELETIIDNSFNIHEIDNKLIFKNEENPKAKLMSTARNDKLFQNGEDIDELAKQIKASIIENSELEKKYNLIILKKNWRDNPWAEVEECANPLNWDNRIPVILIPNTDDDLDLLLGEWLKKNVPVKRNSVRFLIANEDVYYNRELLVLSRAILKSSEWKLSDPKYTGIYKDISKEIKNNLESMFNRFAILERWSFNIPKDCSFHIERHGVTASKILDEMNEQIIKNIFIPEDFEEIVDKFADKNETVGKLLNELKEPRPNNEECIPWIGEELLKDRLIKYCSTGTIVLSLRGTEYLAKAPLESEEDAYNSMKNKLGTGKHLDETILMLPDNLTPKTSQIHFTNTNTTEIDDTYINTPVNRGIQNTNSTPFTIEGVNTLSLSTDETNQVSKANTKEAIHLSAKSVSQMNLLGRLEQWNIKPTTNIKDISISIDSISGEILKSIIESLPDEIKYSIELKKEE